MSLNYFHLDNRTRLLMLEELRLDLSNNNLHISPYLSGQGVHDFANLLEEAMEKGNEDTLASALNRKRRIAVSTHRRRRDAGYTIVTIPENAAEMIAEDVFNRYYIRAICLRALAEGVDEVIVYRAKPVQNPRKRSEELIETAVDPGLLLEDLRAHSGETTDMGIPGGPNSGISVHLPATN